MERQPTVQLIQFHQQIIRDDKESQNHVKHLVDHSGSIDRHRCIDQQTNLEKYRTNSQHKICHSSLEKITLSI